jgi:hypothetical protein
MVAQTALQSLASKLQNAETPEVEVATITDNSTKLATETPTEVNRGEKTGHAEPTREEVAAEAAAIYPDTFPTAPTPEEIAAEAYAIYMARGCDDGRDQEDWYEAERKLRKS